MWVFCYLHRNTRGCQLPSMKLQSVALQLCCLSLCKHSKMLLKRCTVCCCCNRVNRIYIWWKVARVSWRKLVHLCTKIGHTCTWILIMYMYALHGQVIFEATQHNYACIHRVLNYSPVRHQVRLHNWWKVELSLTRKEEWVVASLCLCVVWWVHMYKTGPKITTEFRLDLDPWDIVGLPTWCTMSSSLLILLCLVMNACTCTYMYLW